MIYINMAVTIFVCVAEKPLISKSPVDVTVKAGESAVFNCRFDSTKDPEPEFTMWRIFNNSGNVNRIEKETGLVGANPSTYSILSTHQSDAGKYECFVKNEFGTATSSPATLTVQCKHALLCPNV